MARPIYLQIFSMTDHNAALNQRYQGPYQGMNAALQTSEYQNGKLLISPDVQYRQDPPKVEDIRNSSIVVCYRHTDTGELRGTSESMIYIHELPWVEMPGLEIIELKDDGSLSLRLWNQAAVLNPGKLTRVHFAKTVVYLKNFGGVDEISLSPAALNFGPAHLHAEHIDDNVTMAPPSGSALVVKMGQDIEH